MQTAEEEKSVGVLRNENSHGIFSLDYIEVFNKKLMYISIVIHEIL